MSAILVKSYIGQAERYFEQELTNERETYYSEKGTSVGQWAGRGAEALGLKGEIKKEDFSRMSRGINPATGMRFRRMTLGRTREINGELKEVKEIAGWDMVISAPKSVSIAGLIGRDERVRRAHRESVTDALERAGRQAQANNGGGKKEQTNNLIVGRFSHDSARPSKDGFVAPQLHDHCFIMNATLRADGTLKPLESLELHKAQSYIRSVYYTGLADRLQKLGYGVEIDKETGAPEITGISKEYRAACSPRRAEILELAKKAGKNYRQLGLVNRREKIFDQDLIQEQHRGIEGLFDYQAQRTVQTARVSPPPIGKPETAKEAVTFALAKLSERESVFNPRVVLLEANQRGIGQTSVAAIEAEFETRKRDRKVTTVKLRGGREAIFLAAVQETKSDLPSPIKILQPKESLRTEYFNSVSFKTNNVLEKEFAKFTSEQQDAVVEIVNAATGITKLTEHGGARTTTLSFVNKMAEKAEYEILEITPSAVKRDAGITLQKLLASADTTRIRKRFYVVDQSTFVSPPQMDKFLREAVKTGDRVLLVENTPLYGKTARAAKAEKSFVRAEQSGQSAAGAKIEMSGRRTKKAEREIIGNFSARQSVSFIAELRERGQIREFKDRADRHTAIARAFIAAPKKSLVIISQNEDRREINAKIHRMLKNTGQLGKEESEIKILRPRSDLTGVERAAAASYRAGDIITYTRGSAEHKIAAKSRATVVQADAEQNLLTVEIKDQRDGAEARTITYNPKRLRGVSVWMEDKITVSEGDRLQFRAPFEEKKMKVADGALFEVGKITQNTLVLKDEKGKIVRLTTDQPAAIDYGYAAVSQNSPGKAIERILICAEAAEAKSILNEEIARAAVNRTADKAVIFTDDAEKLVERPAERIEQIDSPQVKAATIKLVSERRAEIVPDPPPVERTDQSEISQPVILPAAETLPRPTTVIKSAQPASAVSEATSAIEPKEVKPFAAAPRVEKSSTPIIEIQPAKGDVFPASRALNDNQKVLIKELVQLSRTSAEQQGLFHSEKAWSWLETVKFPDLATRETPEVHRRFVDFLQEDLPESERISLSGKSEIESTHALLKLLPVEKRATLVGDFFADYNNPPTRVEREIEPVSESAEKNVLADVQFGSHPSESFVALPPVKEQTYNAAEPKETADRLEIERQVQAIEAKFLTQKQYLQQSVAESRFNDFKSVSTDASRYADVIAGQHREKSKSLSPDKLSEIWKDTYRKDYQCRWEDGRTRRMNRRADDLRATIGVDARHQAELQTANVGEQIPRRANLPKIEAVPIERKTNFVMQHLGDAQREWKEFENDEKTSRLAPQNERVIRFFVERDARTAPTADTLSVAAEIARRHQIAAPEVKSELDAKVWVITNLPETGKQLFLENHLERAEMNYTSQMQAMQQIQVNECYRMMLDQAAKTNQAMSEQTLNQMWRNLQEASIAPAIGSEPSPVAASSSNDKQQINHQESVAAFSRLDEIHTTLVKGDEETRETKIKSLIAAVQSLSRAAERIAQTASAVDEESEVLTGSRTISR